MDIAARTDAVIDRSIDEGRIVGTVVKVLRGGEPVYVRAAGYADREAGKPVQEDTIFRYASVTKPFVATAALAMIDAGKFTLDSHVSELLPWFHPPGPDGRQAVITVRQLLTHTAGLTYKPGAGILSVHDSISLGIENTNRTLEENFSLHNTVPLAYQPGTAWEYSIAIDILGAILAEVHGGSVEDALRHYVFAPLGIADTGFRVADRERLATAYYNAEPAPQPMGEPERVKFSEEMTYTFSPARILNREAFQGGGGGMAGTADAVVRLLEMYRRDGTGVLNTETARAACRNQIGDLRLRPGVRFSFIGSVMENPALDNSHLPEGTVAWGGIYGNNWCYHPASGTVVVALTNTAPEGCDGPFKFQLQEAVFG
ncbi:serine hydrolase domain-containing protein [Martelella endophytica]|uniref:Beta-lactamase-related domain-containing protein n=1 Tax=Martelella endophytica TaxID=1486262 RepID=A0A0D5LPQ8_MAREN|nr:serine hydrolase domain-containing protein [Martelella endophytica]AJY45757.1 hypothetical protein TM49_08775 [Martelella endophytica]